MSAGRQYYSCRFRKGDKRTYAYHWDGEELTLCATVKVAARDGDGWTPVVVVDRLPGAPPFQTKPILGLVDEAEQEQRGLL